jgi:FdhE protein
MQQNTMTPEEIAVQAAGEIPFLRLPNRHEVFSDRAARLRQLAPGHAMGGYLELMARVADLQQTMLNERPPLPLPAEAQIAQCREHGMPPLNAQTFRRDPLWHDLLRRMLRQLEEGAAGALRDMLVQLEAGRDELYEAQASRLLANVTVGLDPASAPFIGAVLQVCWTHLVTTLGENCFGRIDVPNVCPCCGSRPTASVVRLGGQEGGYRFLHCSLCAAEWHMVRIKCTHCDTPKGIHYFGIEGGSPAIKAECCDECGSYLKIFYQNKDAQVEPVADDLASVALDLLVAENGKAASGVNLLLIHGDEEE